MLRLFESGGENTRLVFLLDLVSNLGLDPNSAAALFLHDAHQVLDWGINSPLIAITHHPV